MVTFVLLWCQMILSWTGARLEGGQYEKANVNATDNHSSTCMHYAAAAGMKICVEVRESACLHIGMSCFWRLISWISQPYFFQQSLSLTISDQFLQQLQELVVFDYCQI